MVAGLVHQLAPAAKVLPWVLGSASLSAVAWTAARNYWGTTHTMSIEFQRAEEYKFDHKVRAGNNGARSPLVFGGQARAARSLGCTRGTPPPPLAHPAPTPTPAQEREAAGEALMNPWSRHRMVQQI